MARFKDVGISEKFWYEGKEYIKIKPRILFGERKNAMAWDNHIEFVWFEGDKEVSNEKSDRESD